jgi:hypothetical protein
MSESRRELVTNGDNLVRTAIESLLNAATGRPATGNIDDVLTRMVHHSDPYLLASVTTPIGDSDVKRIKEAIWCFLTGKDIYALLGVVATEVGLFPEMSVFEFIRRYGRDFVYQTPFPKQIADDFNGGDRELVGILVLYQLQIDGECLSVSSICRGLRAFIMSVPTSNHTGAVYEKLMCAMAAIEDVAGSRLSNAVEVQRWADIVCGT